MADGTRKPIEQLVVGDKVLAADPITGQTGSHEVTDVRSNWGEKHLVETTVANDTSTAGKITSTDEHPFWVESEHRWVNAKDLTPGYQLETADHRDATVTTTRAWTQYERVYNLTVDTLHTYHVLAGDTPVLAHNCGQANGGKYGDLQPAGSGYEINHIPANSISPLSMYSGPSIRMEYADHRAIYSTGSSLESQAWRMRQREMIAAGDFRGAMMMDIRDIRNRFGNKYDEAIAEMWASLSQNKALRTWLTKRNPWPSTSI